MAETRRNAVTAFRGRYRQARRNAQELADLLPEGMADKMTDSDVMRARALAQDVLQCTHEMNAYRNATKWNVE